MKHGIGPFISAIPTWGRFVEMECHVCARPRLLFLKHSLSGSLLLQKYRTKIASHGYNIVHRAASRYRSFLCLLLRFHIHIYQEATRASHILKEGTRGLPLAATIIKASCSVIKINGWRGQDVQIMQKIVNISDVNSTVTISNQAYRPSQMKWIMTVGNPLLFDTTTRRRNETPRNDASRKSLTSGLMCGPLIEELKFHWARSMAFILLWKTRWINKW